MPFWQVHVQGLDGTPEPVTEPVIALGEAQAAAPDGAEAREMDPLAVPQFAPPEEDPPL